MTEYINETLVPNVLDKHNRSLNPQDGELEPLTRREFLRALGFLKTRERASNDDDNENEVTSDTPPADNNISERTVLR